MPAVFDAATMLSVSLRRCFAPLFAPCLPRRALSTLLIIAATPPRRLPRRSLDYLMPPPMPPAYADATPPRRHVRRFACRLPSLPPLRALTPCLICCHYFADMPLCFRRERCFRRHTRCSYHAHAISPCCLIRVDAAMLLRFQRALHASEREALSSAICRQVLAGER